MAKFVSVDAYIASFPPDVQVKLQSVRAAIHEAVPDTGEAISYDIPMLTLDGKYVVYFAAWKRHISLYPIPSGDATLEKDIGPYKAGKGTLQFALNKPIPLDLIGRVARHLAQERRDGYRRASR